MGKKIILFADGTGNAFSAQESNVWRLFKALDTTRKDQIALYTQGVGTSGFRPWAIFDSATGIGAPANIRKLYTFLCWNWRPGDEIYMFGFSRGAFTIRALIEMINQEGLAPCHLNGRAVSTGRMNRNVMAAYRAYRRNDMSLLTVVPNMIWRFCKQISISLNSLKRRGAISLGMSKEKAAKFDNVFEAIKKQKRTGDDIPIKFVGLFDTVEAYGVPLEELRKAIDWLIWPISFPIDEMSNKVWRVRQALSLDDERETFHPIRIKSKDADKKVNRNGVVGPVQRVLATLGFRLNAEETSKLASNVPQTLEPCKDDERVKEVWFAGVHSDIGGGYPDDQLAYIPLVWMLDEIKAADHEYAEEPPLGVEAGSSGLRFSETAGAEFRAIASPFGVLHDSRAGQGLFYRYSPRKIEEKLRRNAASLQGALVHHSVVSRMLDGADKYVPLGLPATAKVLRSDGEQSPLVAYLSKRAKNSPGDFIKVINEVDAIQDRVLARKLCYFGTMGCLVAFAFLPAWESLIDPSMALLFKSGDASTTNGMPSGFLNVVAHVYYFLTSLFGYIIVALKTIMPTFLTPHLDAMHWHPLAISILFLIAGLCYVAGNRMRDGIRSRARTLWDGIDDIDETIDAWWRYPMRLLRNVKLFFHERGIFFSQYIALSVVVLTSFGIVYAIGITASRVTFNFRVMSGSVCNGSDAKALQWLAGNEQIGVPVLFQTKDPCWASGIGLEKGVPYRLRLDINLDEPWFDRETMTDVGGFESVGFARKLVNWPFLRWPWGGWFQPIARIDSVGDAEWPLTSNDGAGPIPSDFWGCQNMPKSFLETAAFCSPEKSSQCTSKRKDIEKLMGQGALPEAVMEDARRAWFDRKGKRRLGDGTEASCESSYPRTTFVTDFVARRTGELFLFVNDVMPWVGGAANTHYLNNRGSARVTLSRAPLFERRHEQEQSAHVSAQ